MERTLSSVIFFCLASLLVANLEAQTVRYVTDSLKLEARSGPSTGHRITHMLSSGTRVEILERDADSGYSRIRLTNGEEQWILSRYLMDEPPARAQLSALRADLKKEHAEVKHLAEQLQALRAELQRSAQDSSQVEDRNKSLASELSQIKSDAAQALAYKERKEALEIEVAKVRQNLAVARLEIQSMQDQVTQRWFLIGAGTLLGGVILGVVLPKLRWRRGHKWSQL